MSETIITKRCSTCKQVKPISEFHKNQIRKDGHHNQCKFCMKECQRRRQNTKKFKSTQKRYLQSKKGKEKQKRYRLSAKGKVVQKHYNQSERGKETRKIYLLIHPELQKAQYVVRNAIKFGELPRPDSLQCKYCRTQAKQYHHHKGYGPEHLLDVVPVCTRCHFIHTNHKRLIKLDSKR